jgi:glutathione S-transferase
MKLYDYPLSGNGYKVRLMLSHMARPYEYLPVDILAGESRTEAFLEKNPMGKVPVLELDTGEMLPESNAILFLLAQDTPYWPDNRLARAEVMRWLFFEQRDFVAGSRYSIADIALYAYSHLAPEGGFDLGSFDAIRGWISRVQTQPGYVGIDEWIVE